MGLKSVMTPAFSAGPLLMPPIQLQGISGHAAAANLSRSMPQSSFSVPNGQLRFSFWPGLRKLGTRCLYGARVMPLTLTAILHEDHSGSPDMHRNEEGRWVPGAKKSPVRARGVALARRRVSVRDEAA